MPDKRRAPMAMADRLGFDVADGAARLGVSLSTMYELIAASRTAPAEIESFKIGGRRIVPAAALDQYISRKLAEARAAC
jgi:excisionase family DNA binding protein